MDGKEERSNEWNALSEMICKLSGAELVEHLRVRLHQSHEVLGIKDTQGSRVCAGLREAFQLIAAAALGMQQHRLRMP